MAITIGVSAQIFWDYHKIDLPWVIEHCFNDLGFAAVEILCQQPIFKGWGTKKAEKLEREIKDTLSTIDKPLVTIHAPFHDLNLATLNPGIRTETVRQLTECVRFASYIGAPVVVVHPGFNSSRKTKRSVTMGKMIKHLKKIAAVSEDLGVFTCIENLASKEKALGVTVKDMTKIMERVGSEYMQMTLDVAHANTTSDGVIGFAQKMKPYIHHLHLSDNTGGNDHLPIGFGDVDFEGLFKELKGVDCIGIIEGWTPNNQDYFLKWDKEYLENVMAKVS